MKVALYNKHHFLPFCANPSNPTCLFDPSILDGWIFERIEWEKNVKFSKKVPAVEYFVMPVLNGLLKLNLPGVMANVSLIFRSDERVIETPERILVQLTTEPANWSEDGLPIVVVENEVRVQHLWGGDNGTCTPYQLLSKERAGGECTPEFWTEFFFAKLREIKEKVCREAEESILAATEILQAYSLIPE